MTSSQTPRRHRYAKMVTHERTTAIDDGVSPMRWGSTGMSTPAQALGLPEGTVTFLLTDVEGSTRLWGTEPDAVMRAAIVRHYEILHHAVTTNGGVRPQEQGEGDSIVAAFAHPTNALQAATDAQTALHHEPWPTSQPISVRMAIHTGQAHLRDPNNYAGQAIIRTARLRAVTRGGQVLVTDTTRNLVTDQAGTQFEMRSLGEHHLKDLDRPEHIWQLIVPGLPDNFEPLTSQRSTPHSLPAPLSRFIGRTTEISDVTGLISTDRLVTITGSGGAGKTRLAREVGAAILDDFPAGVWWAELAPITDDGVEPTVRACFGISEGSSVALEESVRRLLDEQLCLLILDNCEHVAETVQATVGRLLSHAPTLHVLATSPVMLDVPGETAWRIPPLRQPEPDDDGGAAAAGEAVDVFVDRARRVRPNFALTDDNSPAVAAIVRRLNGIPLAIELAAARCRVLDPQRILTGLDDAFRVLAGGSTAVMARQQTLDASITWSYDLLTPAERTLLRRLAVFIDGWTLDAAEAICANPEPSPDGLDPYTVFDALDRLVDHSLVHTTDTPVGVRFGMLETVRQYTTRLLHANQTEHNAIQERHSNYFTDWASGLEHELLRAWLGETETSVPDAVTADQANIVAATQHALDLGDPGTACGALFGLRVLLDHPAWVPVNRSLVAQIERLRNSVATEDRWKVHSTHRFVLASRSDPLSEVEALELQRQAAEEANQPVGIGSARWQTLIMLSLTGTPVYEELHGVLSRLEPLDQTQAIIGWQMGAVMAAYTGNLRHHTSCRSHAVGSDGSGATAPFILLADGVAAFFTARPAAAIDLLDAAVASGLLSAGNLNTAESIRRRAQVDLGGRPDPDGEARFRRRALVEDNVISGVAADSFAVYRHLLADELDDAHRLHVAVTDRFTALGVSGGAFHANHTLTAVGHGLRPTEEQLDAATSGRVAPTVASEALRSEAECLLRSGKPGTALDRAHQALGIETTEGLFRGMWFTLDCIARILGASRRFDEAARILGACAAFGDERSLVAVPCLQRLTDEALEVCRAALGDDAFNTALTDGATLSLDAAASYARRLRVPHTTATLGWDALTPTEARVAELVAEGLTNPQVAKELLMGTETVKTHLSRVFDKIGVANRKELIVAASRRAADRHR